MNEDINLYKVRKLIYQIMFDLNEQEYLEDTNLFDLVFIESLKNVVEYHVKNNYLSDSVKNNINEYLYQARNYNDENKIERINLINDVIKLMNSQEKDESLIFYRFELLKRRRDFKYVFKYTDEQIKNEIENIHDSICNDLIVTVSHSDVVDDEEFMKYYLPCIGNSELYYESLNVILKENPAVFKNQLFYTRMLTVLTHNDELYEDKKEVLEYNNKLIKRINKKRK